MSRKEQVFRVHHLGLALLLLLYAHASLDLAIFFVFVLVLRLSNLFTTLQTLLAYPLSISVNDAKLGNDEIMVHFLVKLHQICRRSFLSFYLTSFIALLNLIRFPAFLYLLLCKKKDEWMKKMCLLFEIHSHIGFVVIIYRTCTCLYVWMSMYNVCMYVRTCVCIIINYYLLCKLEGFFRRFRLIAKNCVCSTNILALYSD